MLLLAGLTSLLGACGTLAPSVQVQVTGQWRGALSYGENLPGMTLMELDLTQATTGGDFTGTLSAGDGKTASVSGNATNGTLNSTLNDLPLSCKGTFTSGPKYTGTCTLGLATRELSIYKTN